MLDPSGKTFDITPFVDVRYKTPVSEMQFAVNESLSPNQVFKLRQCLAHIDELEAHRREIKQEIPLLTKPFPTVLTSLYTLPGLGKNPMIAIWNM